MTPADRQALLLTRAKADPDERLRLIGPELLQYADDLRLFQLIGIMFEEEPGTWRLESARRSGSDRH